MSTVSALIFVAIFFVALPIVALLLVRRYSAAGQRRHERARRHARGERRPTIDLVDSGPPHVRDQ
jgi:hypothetical protein